MITLIEEITLKHYIVIGISERFFIVQTYQRYGMDKNYKNQIQYIKITQWSKVYEESLFWVWVD